MHLVDLLKVAPAFALTAFILALVPGQGMAMILRQSLVGGKRAAFASVLGNSSGLLIWGGASAIGLSQIFAHSPTAYSVLKYAGVAFLVYLSFQTLLALRHEYGKFELNGSAKLGWGSAYRLGVITNLTNVKAAVFAVAFIPQFVPRTVNLGLGIFLLSCIQATVSTSWYALLVKAVDRASVLLARPKVRRGLTGLSAAGILFLAITLLVTSPR